MEFLDAERTVALTATYCRVEQLVFSLLGSWAPTIADPAARVAAVELADHAAWRARRWYEVLPTAPPGPDALLADAPADLEFADLVEAAAGPTDAGRFAVIVEGLLPLLHRELTAHLDHAGEIAQRPIVRIAAITRTDLDADLAAGLGVLERLVADAGARTEADRAGGELAAAIARTGGPFRS